MDLNHKLVVVTGAASGMGEASARQLSKLGAQVVILDRDIEQAKLVANDIQGIAIDCDVSSAESCESAFAQIAQMNKPLVACINCAGIAPAKRIVGREGAMPLTDFNRVIEVNLIGTFNVLRLAAELMQKHDILAETQERGVIINTASIAAYEGQIGQAAYSASKGGVVALTLPAAREFAQFGIRVNCIAPGLIATPLLLNMPQAVQDSLSATVPFPARFGKPEEYAALVQHILENQLINGEVIRLDGALRMQAK